MSANSGEVQIDFTDKFVSTDDANNVAGKICNRIKNIIRHVLTGNAFSPAVKSPPQKELLNLIKKLLPKSMNYIFSSKNLTKA